MKIENPRIVQTSKNINTINGLITADTYDDLSSYYQVHYQVLRDTEMWTDEHSINFQVGNFSEIGRNGLYEHDLLVILKDRFEQYLKMDPKDEKVQSLVFHINRMCELAKQ